MSPVSRRAFLASCLALGVAPRLRALGLGGAGKADSLGFRRASTLNRGVNLSGWYGGWGEYTPEHLSTWTTPADFAFIHATGLQYVRLCVEPVRLSAGGFDSPASVAALAVLDKSIQDILAAGLSLSITIFPRSDYKQALLTPAGAAAFNDLWKFFATRYAAQDPERVFFDLLNEPEIKDPAAWNALQANVVEVIRAVNKTHTIIATGNNYAGIDELLLVKPVHDDNVVYTFHFYEPFPFTHQGATWSSSGLEKLSNVPYPGDPEVLGPMVASTTDPGARSQLAQYASEGWDASVMLHRIKQARTWADAHHVPVICNEFGAFRDTITPEHRGVYLHDVRTTLESLHIPWAEWDYRGNFGIVSHGPDGSIIPDPPVLQALGLTVPPPTATPLPVPTVAPTAPATPTAATGPAQ